MSPPEGPGGEPLATFRSGGPWLPLLAMTRANLRLLSRNRQVLVFNVMVPLLLIVIFGGLFQGSKQAVDVSVPASYRAAIRQALPSSSFALRYVSPATARREVLDNKADFALVAGSGQVRPLRVRVEENAGNVTLNGAYTAVAEAAISVLNQELLQTQPAVEPDLEQIHPPGGVSAGSLANTNYIDFLTPGILAYAVLTAGLTAGVRLVGDRERGTLRRVRATPIPVWAFLASSVISQLLLVAVQVAVLLAVGHLMYGVGLGPTPAAVILMLLVGSLCFLAGGFLIAGIARRDQAAIVLANMIILPQLFVAGIFYPLAGAPAWLRDLSVIMPLTYFSNALRGLMAQGQNVGQVAGDLAILLVIGVVALAVATRIFRFEPAASGS